MLKPKQIRDKEFSVKLRGYNVQQVNNFLNEVEKSYIALLKQKNQVVRDNKTLKKRVNHYSKMNSDISSSLVIAQRASKRVKARARAKANRMVKHAQKDAHSTITLTKCRTQQLVAENVNIKSKAYALKKHLIKILNGQVKSLKNGNWGKKPQKPAILKHKKHKAHHSSQTILCLPDGTYEDF